MQEYLTHRRKLIPYLAKKIKAKSYLEIGVRGGKTFYPVKVRKKFAVDPEFRIKSEYRREQSWRYWPNFWARLFECTSDEFFANHADDVLQKGRLDLAFIDGLHTADQTYIDVVNTMPFMADDGIIVVHDCSPKSAAAAYPADSIDEVKRIKPPGFNGMWSGDVWKIMPRLRSDFPDHSMFVIDHDSGIGLISKQKLFTKDETFNEKISFTADDIKSWGYEELDANRKALLNLVSDQDILQHCKLFN